MPKTLGFFSVFGCFVFEIWVLRFRDLGASCFGLRFRVLRFRNYPYNTEAAIDSAAAIFIKRLQQHGQSFMTKLNFWKRYGIRLDSFSYLS